MSTTPNQEGQYQISILYKNQHIINSPLNLKTQKLIPFTFDTSECNPNITLSENNLVATLHQGGYASVLGTVEMYQGKHNWKIRIRKINDNSHWMAFGVCKKPLPNNNVNFNSSYGWSSRNQIHTGNTQANLPQVSGDWINGDVIEMTLDCDNHTLTIKNNRTNKTASMNVPNDSLFPYFNLLNLGNSITLQF